MQINTKDWLWQPLAMAGRPLQSRLEPIITFREMMVCELLGHSMGSNEHQSSHKLLFIWGSNSDRRPTWVSTSITCILWRPTGYHVTGQWPVGLWAMGCSSEAQCCHLLNKHPDVDSNLAALAQQSHVSLILSTALFNQWASALPSFGHAMAITIAGGFTNTQA